MNSRHGYTDSQRKRLYKAEREAFKGGEHDRKITEAEARELIEKVWETTGLSGGVRVPDLITTRKKGYGAAHYMSWGHSITFNPDCIQPWVVVHELAHAVEEKGAAHGPEFARAYLKLVERTFGFEVRERLGAAFRKYKVRSQGASTPKKKGVGPKRETKMQKALKLSDSIGVKFRTIGWERHWYTIDGPGGECGRDCYGLDEVIRELESRGAR